MCKWTRCSDLCLAVHVAVAGGSLLVQLIVVHVARSADARAVGLLEGTVQSTADAGGSA